MPVMEQEQRLLTVEDIARILGRSEETVKRLLRKGELPGVKIGGNWYIPPEDWRKHLETLKKR